MKKLKEKDWKEIRRLLKKKDRNITKIAKYYGITRNSIYAYCKRRNWLHNNKEKKKKSFWKKVKNFFSKG